MMTRMKNRYADESGLAERILVGVIAWALASVVMLTSTLITANQIDDKVAYIRTQVSPIDNDLDSVELAARTNVIAKDILTAAEPLSGQLQQVLDTTIHDKAISIDQTAGEINRTVNSISATASEINGTAGSINSKVTAINGSVRSIQGHANSINGTVHGIGGNFGGILDTVRQIRGDHQVEGLGGGLAGAARRVDVLIGLVTAIKGDTGNILGKVGSIEASAKSIDNKL